MENQSNNVNTLLDVVPDLSLQWRKLVEDNTISDEEKDKLFDAMDTLERKGIIVLKFGI